jgi:hypothetical protein
MKRKIRIAKGMAKLTALVGLLALAVPTVAAANGPLLSGYGGPGAGEQAIIGSTLVGGSRGGHGSGGAGSGGTTGSQSKSEASRGGGALAPSSGSAARGGSASGGGVQSSKGEKAQDGHAGSSKRLAGGARQPGRSAGSAPIPVRAYVYPSAIASRSDGSSITSISVAGILLLLGIVAILGLVAIFTARIARLQP